MKFKNLQGNEVEKPDDKEVKQRTSAYGIIVKEKKALMVMPTWNDSWEFPGGGVDSGETVDDALIREFLEETGHAILDHDTNPIITLQQYFYADDLDEYYDSTLIFFRVLELGEQHENLIMRDEIKEVKWVDISETHMRALHKKALETLHRNL